MDPYRGPHVAVAEGLIMRSNPRCRGFSLIEILVVVAIIALLITMLLPALTRARKAARSAVCLANLMSIGSGMKMYQGDYRGWLPVGPPDKLWYIDSKGTIFTEPGPGRRPYPWSNCHWGGKRAAYNHDIVNKPPQPEKLKRPLTNYLYHGASLDSETPLFQCPDDVGTPLYSNPIGSCSVYYLCGNSYWTNPWQKFNQVGQRRVKSPSVVVLVEEAPFYFGVAMGLQTDGWHGRFSAHNMLFLDFHAATNLADTHKPCGPGWYAENYFDIMDYYKY
jgi:prepilin-type N-terminal cleavage/methylation domain-containing protein